MVEITTKLSKINNYEMLIIKDARFYTTHNDGKYKTKIKTKGVTIYVPNDEKAKKDLTRFGLKVYEAEDKKTGEKVTFIMTRFSGNALFYDTDAKTKKSYCFDDNYPNVDGEHFTFVIMDFTDDNDNNFNRVVAWRGASSNLVKMQLDYFDDDDAFEDVGSDIEAENN